jgi:hypothetical protein
LASTWLSCVLSVLAHVGVTPFRQAAMTGLKTSLPPIVSVISRTSSTGVAFPFRSSSSATAPGS